MSNQKSNEMKKNYFVAALLVFAFAVNLNAQFIELDGKEPVFHIKFDETVGNHLKVEGTQFNNWETFDGNWVTDTVTGHPWGGEGDFNDLTLEEQIVSSENFAELFLPAIHWDSYLSVSGRPQGIAAYDGAAGAYGGPRADSARTISFYVMVTDSARADTLNGAWDVPYFYGTGNWQVDGERLYWYLDPAAMKFTLFFGGDSRSITADDVIPKNEWVHLALTVPQGGARADMKLWVNGVVTPFAEEQGDMTTLNTTLEAAWDGIRVGALVNLWMADYRIYDSELTEDDFNTLLGLNVSARDFDQENLFNVYPVPNDGIFKVEVSDPGRWNIVLRNTLGQVVHDQIVDQTEMINVSHLPTGMYFVSLCDDNKNIQTRKVIIK